MNRTEGYYWCKLDNKWDIYHYNEIWSDFFKNTYKDHDFEEIDERPISRPTGLDLQLRSDNLVYNQGRVYGRKVSISKSYPLTDHIFEETIKKIL